MSKLVDPVPVGVDAVAWRTTRRLRESISELHKIYALHMKEKHQIVKVCLCQEMENYTKAYAYYKQELMQALYPPSPEDITRSFEDRAKLIDLLKDNIIDEQTINSLLGLAQPNQDSEE